MKPVLFFPALVLLLFSHLFPLLAQPPAGIVITESYVNTPLPQVLQQLQEKYRLTIFYKPEWVNNQLVTAAFQSTPLPRALAGILKNTGLTFIQHAPRTLVLLPSDNSPLAPTDSLARLPVQAAHNRQKILLSGTVKDAQTGTPIAGAVIYSPKNKSGTITDTNGAFTLPLVSGDNQVTSSYVGYAKESREFTLTEDASLHFQMYKLSAQLSEVEVIGGRRLDANVSSPQTGVTHLDMSTIKKMPAFLGEVDVIKSIQLLPGVSTVGEAATGFNVRGGSTDQNLVLLDEAPIFNSSHLFGFFSIFNPGAVQDMTLYRGGIPAQYGGRISSVLDVKQKEGSFQKFSGSGGIGIVSGRLALEGPIFKNKTSFLVSGRSSYSNWLLRKMPDITIRNSQASFYDGSAKISHAFNLRNKLSLSAYRSSDDFGFTRDTLYQWVSTTASLKYTHTFSHRLIMDVTGVYSDYDFRVLNELPENASVYRNGIRLKNLKTDFQHTTDKHQLHFGASVIGYDLNPGSLNPGSESSAIVPLGLAREHAVESALYLNEEWEASPRLTLMAGLRYSLYGHYGPGEVYRYQADRPRAARTITDTLYYAAGQLIQSYQGLEPRFSVKYSLDENSSLKLGYNRNRQYLHLISNTVAVSPTDFWKSSNTYLRPQLGDQVSLGYFRNFHQNNIEAAVEGYYKHLRHLLDYKNGARLFLNPTLEADLLAGTGRAYGVEMSLNKKTGRLTGWFSYTYARTLLAVQGPTAEETINGGAFYPASFDKPHTLNMSSNYQVKKRLSWSANFTFSSGRPITAPLSQYVIGQYVVPNFGERNQYRIPAYHRLDLAISLQSNFKKEKKWVGSWNFSVYNVYGRKNPYSVFFKQVQGSPPKAYQLAVIGVPLPAISYDFKF